VGGKSSVTVSVYEPFVGPIQVEVLEKNIREDTGLKLATSLLAMLGAIIAINY